MNENEQRSAAAVDQSRRDFLRNVLFLGGGAVLGVGLLHEVSQTPDNAANPTPDTATTIVAVPNGIAPESLKPNFEFGPVFADAAAEKAATDLGINPGSYFKLNQEAVTKVNQSGLFATEEHLLPVFSPAIMDKADVIEKAAKMFNIPVNIFGSLGMIESAGDVKAHSGADAWGLVQVVPRYHLAKYVEHGFLPAEATFSDYQAALKGQPSQVSKDDYLKALTDVEASTTVGAQYFSECIASARNKNPKLPANDLRVFAIAAAAYNGGPGLTGQSFDKWPLESKLYVNFVSRFILDIEVAGKLRQGGMDDRAILRAMQSKEIEARAYAYSQFKYSDFQSYEDHAAMLTYPIPGVDPAVGDYTTDEQRLMNSNWQDYQDLQAKIPNGAKNQYVIPAPPALRIWLASGGMSLFAKLPENANWRLN